MSASWTAADILDAAGLENVMKSFNFSLHLNTSEIKGITDFNDKIYLEIVRYPFSIRTGLILDIFDVQNIMKEGRIDDFMKCIQSILNYSFDTYTSNSNVKVLDSSFIKFFHVAQVIIRFLLHWKSELFKENTKLKNQIQVSSTLVLFLSIFFVIDVLYFCFLTGAGKIT